jgi:hypothetical protein
VSCPAEAREPGPADQTPARSESWESQEVSRVASRAGAPPGLPSASCRLPCRSSRSTRSDCWDAPDVRGAPDAPGGRGERSACCACSFPSVAGSWRSLSSALPVPGRLPERGWG